MTFLKPTVTTGTDRQRPANNNQMTHAEIKEKEQALQVGNKITFVNELQPYTIKARSERYAICTKPFNLKKTVIYTIVDFEAERRAPNDRIFNPYNYKKQEDVDKCLVDLVKEKIFLSRRRGADLFIDWERTEALNYMPSKKVRKKILEASMRDLKIPKLKTNE